MGPKLVWLALVGWLLPGAVQALVDERIPLDETVSIEATFNRPGLDDDASTRLQDRMIQLIDQAASGARIYVSIYTFNAEDVAVALLEARDRGVTVRMLVDSKSVRRGSPALELLMAGAAPLDGCDGPCIKVCRAGCHGFHINHNKFVLISELRDGSRWVVAQTSANFTVGQHRQYNDLLVIKNDQALYQAFKGYFDDLNRRLWSPRYFRRTEETSGIAAYFFPRLFGPDPILAILEGIRCDPDAVIRVAHSRFEVSRLGVAKRLRQLADRGCDVHVILRDEPGKFSPARSVMGELDGLVTVLPYESGDGNHNAIHTKMMLVNAPYAGTEGRRHLVLTGSHNLSVTSLHLNDEVLLRVESEALFDVYEAFWDGILQEHLTR